MTQHEPRGRLPLPSEDTGDLNDTSASGQTGGVEDSVLDRAIDALRRSELPAGNRIRLALRGRTMHVSGQVESIDILEEILALLGDVEGVEHVVDETTVGGM